ncbi:hypothetical protein [Pedobacter africanus]|uniref:Uncharacterized protein n=1 Tax=Pedobacter africanus TaxID=151894 RepID=A0A1W1Z7F9_9SPHI|nr:hypothetical protein [Pedobacter africanus]SMC44242.1 hypothetical protein SAMN04488524_0431 [Pedobacter africanus]
MENDLSVSIGRFDRANHNTTLSTNEWNRLLWFTAGDELVFVPAGSVFEEDKFAGDGWVLEFNQHFAVDYLERYPDLHNHALVSNTVRGQISMLLTEALRSEMNELAILLNHAQEKGQSKLYLQAYADLIFLNANQLYAKQNGSV